MKKIFTIIFAISALSIFAQAPQKISYQGVARSSAGTVLANQALGVKFDLHQSAPTGTVPYSETHNVTTNQFGLFTIEIGTGAPVGNFSTINWQSGTYFLEISIDVAGGTSYISFSNQQLMSVPYALYAERAGNSSPTPTVNINAPNTVSNPSTGVYNITVPNPSLTVNSNSLSISNGNTVLLPTGTTYSAGPGIGISGGIISNIVPTQTLSISGNTLDISNGNSVVLPPGTTYTAGSGINISGTSITSTASIVGTGATTVTGVYPNLTISSPTAQAYTAGNGIDISAIGVISNTAAAVTPTITGIGSATVTSSGNTFTVNTPASQVYTAGSGISITSGSIITNNAPAITPTITSAGIANVTPSTGNSFIVDVPAPVLTYNSGTKELTITQGSAVSTETLNGTGSSTVSIVGSGMASVSPTTGSTFTVTVPNPTLSVVSGSIAITGGNSVALPTQSLSVNSGSLSISGPGGNTVLLPSNNYVGTTGNIAITGNTVSLLNTAVTQGSYGGAPYTVPTFSVDVYGRLQSAGNFTPNVAGDLNGTISNATVTGLQGRPVANTAPGVSQVLAWNGATWTPSNTAVATPPAIIGTGVATVNNASPNYTVNVPMSSYNNTSGVFTTGSQTIAVTPTLTLAGNILRSGPASNTITLPSTPATTITQGTNNNIVVTGGASTFTISAPSYSLNVSTNTLTLTNGVNTSTAVMATPLLAYNSNTTSLTSTLSIGTQSITMANWSLNGNGGTTPGTHYLGTSDVNDVSFKTSAVERMRLWSTGGLNIGGSTVTAPFASGITLRGAPAASYGQLNINSTSGAAANQAYLTFSGGVGGVLKGALGDLLTTDDDIYLLSNNNLKLGAVTFSASPAIIVEGVSNKVGIGTTAALNDKVEIDFISNGTVGLASSHLHVKQIAGGDAFSRIKFSNTVAPTKYWINSVTSDPSDINSGYNIFYYNGAVGHNIFTVGGDGKVSVNPFSTINNAILDVKGRLRVDSSLTMAAYNTPPAQSSTNEGRIYYDRPTNKFKVSENGQPYVNLISSPSPWGYSTGVISPISNPTSDKVAIGQTTASSLLDVFNGAGSGVTANAVARIANANPSFSASGVLEVTKTDGFGALIYATNTHSVGDGLSINMSNANNGSNAIQVQQFGLGNAAYFDVNNVSSNACAVEGRITNGTPSSVGIRGLNFGTAGNAGSFALTNGANSQSALSVTNAGQGQGGFFANTNSASFSSAIYAQSNSRSAALTAINTNTTDAAAVGIEAHAEIASAIVANNTSSTNAAARFTNTGSGMALSVESTSNTDPTAYIQNNGSFDGLAVQASGGKAIYAINSSSTSSTIYSNNGGTGDGLVTVANQGRALMVQNSSNTSAAAEIANNGNNTSLTAYKTAATTGGNVASFANASSGNGADAVLVTNSGGGSAIHAISAASSTVALWVENGHMKSTGGSVGTGALNVNGFLTPALAPILTNCTDVKGVFSFTTSPSGLAAGSFIELEIRFSKAYSTPPTVVATPLTDLMGFSYMVTNITGPSFFVRVYRTSNANITLPTTFPAGSTFRFSYYVIE